MLDLLRADYTFVNERLARHYGIPGIYGSRFRRVTLPNPDQRGGLLAHGALLATTSYPDRTSPVLRGKWLLNNIFGLPVPPPPPGVDTNLPETKPGAAPPTIRERLAQHGTNPVVQQLSFGDRSARVRAREFRRRSAAGGPSTNRASRSTRAARRSSGAKVEGLAGLRALLLEQPEQFPRTVTEKLLAYALGRRLEYYDQPAVRKIVRDAAAQRLPLVVAHSRDREEPDVSDAGVAGIDELTGDDRHDFPHCEIVAAADRPARARRDAGAAVPRGDAARVLAARRAPPRSRRTGSRPSTCRTGWRWSTGRRRARAARFELSPILEPLAPFRNQMLVLSGLKANWNYIHAGASGSFLTGTTRGGRNEVEIIADVSMDQLLARHFAQRDAGGVARARDGSRRPTPARAPAT